MWTDFIRSIIFSMFQNYQNPGCLYNVTPTFDRCHCSWAAVAWQIWTRFKILKSFFCKIKICRNGEINERSFCNPHPSAADEWRRHGPELRSALPATWEGDTPVTSAFPLQTASNTAHQRITFTKGEQFGFDVSMLLAWREKSKKMVKYKLLNKQWFKISWCSSL